jgi:hypothetical protein
MEQRSNLRFHAQFRSSFSSIAMVGGEGSLMDLSIRGCRIESFIAVITALQFRFRQQLSGGVERGNSASSLR